MTLTDSELQLKARFEDQRGVWQPAHGSVVKLDPDYFEAYLQLRAVPINRHALEPKVQELILLAVAASCTHLWQPGIHAHTATALRNGASRDEVLEVLELSSVLGIHAMSVGVPLLKDVLQEEGKTDDSNPSSSSGELDEHRAQLKESFQSQRGYWSVSWDNLLSLDPDFFEAYTRYSSVPFQQGKSKLEPKIKELVYCAIDCATTHLYAPGLKTHIRNAVRLGASKEEILEVFELASLMGAHTVLEGAPVLMESLARGLEKSG